MIISKLKTINFIDYEKLPTKLYAAYRNKYRDVYNSICNCM